MGPDECASLSGFPLGVARPMAGLPEMVGSDRDVAWRAFHVSLNKAAALMARSSLETAVKDLGAGAVATSWRRLGTFGSFRTTPLSCRPVTDE